MLACLCCSGLFRPCHALAACLCHNPMPATLVCVCHCVHSSPCAPGSSVLQRLPCRQLHHGDCIEQPVHHLVFACVQTIHFIARRSQGLHWAAGYLPVLVFTAPLHSFHEPETAFGQPGYPLQMACGMAYGMPVWKKIIILMYSKL